MSIDVTLDLQVSAEHREELINTLEAILPDTRAYKGCQSVVVTSNDDDPLNIVLLEKWDVRADHESYIAWRTERGDLEKLGALLTAPPASKYLTTVDV
ncbi:MAG TPA: antibiotic biosynthesis monooxygenase [Cycloclasticus sp.]|jgi:quinol monooxygenase YgiN|nr:antibiotic biosynthesis monooxygenase [Cycloclasticus sp.]HIL92309.1 antibiotic biosynthesis monooxygenase [Cycloclasticus sp.]